MTTVFEMTLQVMREVVDAFMKGAATGGSTTTLIDTDNLKQNDQYWDEGTAWIHSGNNADKILVVEGYANNTLTLPTQASTFAAADRYTVAKGSYPYRQILGAIQSALDDTYILAEDETLLGDGTTLIFTLPAGVERVRRVEIEDVNDSTRQFISNHWRERDGSLRFDYGHAPKSNFVIHTFYETYHDELTAAADTIHPSINSNWVKWRSCENLLYWGVRTYGDSPEFRIQELMNRVIAKQKNLLAHSPRFIVHTGG